MVRQKPEPRELEGVVSHIGPLRLTVVCRWTDICKSRLLRRAAALVTSLGAEIQVLVPMVTPYPLPVEQPPVELCLAISSIKEECREAGIEAKVELLLCRDVAECLGNTIAPGAMVVMRQPGIWQWSERLLVRRLRGAGCQVITL